MVRPSVNVVPGFPQIRRDGWRPQRPAVVSLLSLNLVAGFAAFANAYHGALSVPDYAPMSDESRLQHFPVSFFATVMGLAGFAMAVDRAEQVLGLPLSLGMPLTLVAGGVYVAVALLYLVKLIKHPQAVKDELNHPVRLSFFPTISIGLILLATALVKLAPTISLVLWAIGAAGQLAFTLFVLSRWINSTAFEVQHSNPSWFIPVVGNILVPAAGVAHGFVELSWFYFSFGMVFWLVLMTIVFNRIIFHHPLPDKLVPTFFILIAPPAAGFISYVKLTGELDVFARILFYTALFFGLLVLSLHRRFLGLDFFLSWWAYSFPMAALTIATMVMAQQTGGVFFFGLAWVLLAALSLLMMILVVRTLIAIARGRVCVPE
jgi:tellurite resistance protein